MDDKTKAALRGCKTTAQFKILSWLMAQGVTQDDIARMDLLSDTRIRVTNPAGQYMALDYINGAVRIERDDGC